jgi:hypothetical protein
MKTGGEDKCPFQREAVNSDESAFVKHNTTHPTLVSKLSLETDTDSLTSELFPSWGSELITIPETPEKFQWEVAFLISVRRAIPASVQLPPRIARIEDMD